MLALSSLWRSRHRPGPKPYRASLIMGRSSFFNVCRSFADHLSFFLSSGLISKVDLAILRSAYGRSAGLRKIVRDPAARRGEVT